MQYLLLEKFGHKDKETPTIYHFVTVVWILSYVHLTETVGYT